MRGVEQASAEMPQRLAGLVKLDDRIQLGAAAAVFVGAAAIECPNVTIGSDGNPGSSAPVPTVRQLRPIRNGSIRTGQATIGRSVAGLCVHGELKGRNQSNCEQKRGDLDVAGIGHWGAFQKMDFSSMERCACSCL